MSPVTHDHSQTAHQLPTRKGPLYVLFLRLWVPLCLHNLSVFLERQLHGIIATCHSQVNSPLSSCSGEQSLFSLSSVGALLLAFEPHSANASIWTEVIRSKHFGSSWNTPCTSAKSMWDDRFSCPEGPLKQISSLSTGNSPDKLIWRFFFFCLRKIRLY